MLSLFSLLDGLFAKVYDDLRDNIFLQKCCNDTLMEFLHLFSFKTHHFIYEKCHNQVYQHNQIEHPFFLTF